MLSQFQSLVFQSMVIILHFLSKGSPHISGDKALFWLQLIWPFVVKEKKVISIKTMLTLKGKIILFHPRIDVAKGKYAEVF